MIKISIRIESNLVELNNDNDISFYNKKGKGNNEAIL